MPFLRQNFGDLSADRGMRGSFIAVARLLRTLGLRGVWGLRPQPGVAPLHPVLSLVAIAIKQNPWKIDFVLVISDAYHQTLRRASIFFSALLMVVKLTTTLLLWDSRWEILFPPPHRDPSNDGNHPEQKQSEYRPFSPSGYDLVTKPPIPLCLLPAGQNPNGLEARNWKTFQRRMGA
jgi:hypothetical protein